MSYSIVHYYTQFNETLLDKVGAILKENLGPPITKRSYDSCLKENQKRWATCTFLWSVKLMSSISNLFFHLVEMTSYQKYY